MGRTSVVAIVTWEGLLHLVRESQECAASFSVERLLQKIRLKPRRGAAEATVSPRVEGRSSRGQVEVLS